MTTYTKSSTNKDINSTEIKLADRELYNIDLRGDSLKIKSQRGTLWITIPNDPDDYFLKTGEKLEINTKGRVVVQAITEACFSLN